MKADLVVTDPPYNVAYAGKRKERELILNDNMSDVNFKKFLNAAFKNFADVLKDGRSFYVWHSSSEQMNFQKALEGAKLTVRQQLIWNKSHFTLTRSDYQNKHEPCFYGWKDGATHYFCDSRAESTIIEDNKEKKKMGKPELIKYIRELKNPKVATTIINEDKPLSSPEHPTMKPLKLIGYLIKNSSQQGESVLDPFGGSGSTLIACEQLNRSCYTMELDEKYCDVIIKRWEQLAGQKATLN